MYTCYEEKGKKLKVISNVDGVVKKNQTDPTIATTIAKIL